MDSRADTMLKKHFSIRYATFLLLCVIESEGPRVSQVRIAETLCISPPALTKQIPKLVERRWISIENNPKDRRETLVTLTEEWARFMNQIKRLLEDGFFQAVSAIVTEAELENSGRLLEKIRHHLIISSVSPPWTTRS